MTQTSARSTMPNTRDTLGDVQGHEQNLLVKLTFNLHPGRSLHLSVHENVTNGSELSARALSYDGGNVINDDGKEREEGEGGGSGGKFAIMDAKRITSLTHLAMAGNAALLRYERSKTAEGGVKRKRGIALDTIVCAGGSSNVGNVLREFSFIQNHQSQLSDEGSCKVSKKEKEATPTNSKTEVILALGYDCSNGDDYETFLSDIGLTSTTSPEGEIVNQTGSAKRVPIESYLQRDRTEQDVKDMLRVFKLTKEEINVDQGGDAALDMAVVNRIATKFTV